MARVFDGVHLVTVAATTVTMLWGIDIYMYVYIIIIGVITIDPMRVVVSMPLLMKSSERTYVDQGSLAFALL